MGRHLLKQWQVELLRHREELCRHSIHIALAFLLFFHEDQGQVCSVAVVFGVIDMVHFQGQLLLLIRFQQLVGAVFDNFIHTVVKATFQLQDFFPPFTPGQGRTAAIGRKIGFAEIPVYVAQADSSLGIGHVPNHKVAFPVNIEARRFYMDFGSALGAGIKK